MALVCASECSRPAETPNIPYDAETPPPYAIVEDVVDVLELLCETETLMDVKKSPIDLDFP